MLKLNTMTRTLVTAWTMILFVGSAGSALADDECVANIRVTNQRRNAVKVVGFHYKIDGEPTVFKQNLTTKLVAGNATVTWSSERLSSAHRGAVIAATAVEYQVSQSKGGVETGFAPATMSQWSRNVIRCDMGYDYVHYIDG